MNLEAEYETIVRGMAYPQGTYNDCVVESLTQCGIVYSRTTVSTENFGMPTDWLRLPATCHHNNPHLMELAKKFIDEKGYTGPRMFYLWGHRSSMTLNRLKRFKLINRKGELSGE